MSTPSPSTLRERIAALQQRGSSPQPNSPPRSQTQTSPSNAGGTALRDKIARFEKKGGTPIPRGEQTPLTIESGYSSLPPLPSYTGSFGLGAPPQPTGKRNNELWGNRLPSATRPTNNVPPSVDQTPSLLTRSPSRPRHVSMVNVQRGSVENLQALEDEQTESSPIQSLDIVKLTPASPGSPGSPAHEVLLSPLLPAEVDREASSRHDSVTAPPISSTLPIIIVQKGDDVPEPESPPDDFSSGVELSVDVDITPVAVTVRDKDAMDNSPTPTPTATTLVPPSYMSRPHVNVSSPAALSLSSAEREGEPISVTTPDVLSCPISHSENPPAESLVLSSGPTERSSAPQLLRTPAEISPDHVLASNEPGFPSHSLHAESPSVLASAENQRDSVLHMEEVPEISVRDDEPCVEMASSLSLPSDSPLLAITDGESVVGDLCLLEAKVPTKRLSTTTPNHSVRELPYTEHLIPEIMLPRTPDPHNREVASDPSVPELQTTICTPDNRLSTASPSISEANSESPLRVTPILDAFPAVPRFLPSSSLPARARTISGHPRAANRMSASSTSSTKSTPSLSFSSTSSSTSSPTSVVHGPQHSSDFRRSGSGLQRSKSQTRPTSSVPTWYDDDSDDGEVGWANVIVTTRRYY